jgi:carbamoyltransferase
MDVGASVQAVVDEVMLRLTRSTVSETGIDNVCLAGGVALLTADRLIVRSS